MGLLDTLQLVLLIHGNCAPCITFAANTACMLPSLGHSPSPFLPHFRAGALISHRYAGEQPASRTRLAQGRTSSFQFPFWFIAMLRCFKVFVANRLRIQEHCNFLFPCRSSLRLRGCMADLPCICQDVSKFKETMSPCPACLFAFPVDRLAEGGAVGIPVSIHQ